LSAPSHHLGVDAFVGTVGLPDVIATPGLGQAIVLLSVVMEPACHRPVNVRPSDRARGLARRSLHGLGRIEPDPTLSGRLTRRVVERVASSDSRMRAAMPGQEMSCHRQERDTAEQREHNHRFGAHNDIHLQGALRGVARSGRSSDGRRAMFCVSEASSMRGGRSTRASHQSRPQRLTPRRADATRGIAPDGAVHGRPEPPPSWHDSRP